ncbi:hypothetical protein ES703_34743 [subsurface metagenome]
MLTLGVSQKPIVMPRYAHMMALDRDVWTRFLESGNFPLKEVWYDVHVGKPVTGDSTADALGAGIAAALTRKRIDVVAHVGGGYWVVEVKPRADMLALGQVLSYARLFAREYRVDGEILPVVVCDQVDEDLLDEYEEFGVGVISNEYSEF